ncbi:MAG: phosphodiester glycosidase family protein [Deltaproteobacteria bacterium]|nr:phosphodiester glycosidase family protein [Deltaproteobacteria bacterium]
MSVSTPVPADDLQSAPDVKGEVKTIQNDKDLEKALYDYKPIPDWLEAVLNRLPSETGIGLNARVEDESLNKEIEQSFTSPKKQVPSTLVGSIGSLQNIPPLYSSPRIEGEGVWVSTDTPVGSDGNPLIYKTVYRPSVEFPNSVVYMAVFDMSRLKTRLFIGQTEPGIYQISDTTPHESLSRIVAITNAMWMQQHARGAGAIFRGKVIYPMVPGMATLVLYNDDSVDVLEWSNDIPISRVKDARQLRHLILKDGKVVNQVIKNGKTTDAEIGLGGFLIDNDGSSTMNKEFWYLANRTAFGIRDDGNLVFAMGHHVSTKDLARALALAGCKRAIHGDANIHNIVCNFYFRDENNKIIKRDRLSPEQLQYTMKRYDQGYAKDFFAFYEK